MFWFFWGCQEFRSVVVANYPMNYEVPTVQAGELLQKVLEARPQITDMLFFDNDTKIILLHKSGELVLYDHKDGAFTNEKVISTLEVKTNAEQGLLGIAIHPNYSKNKLIYLHITPKAGLDRTEVAEYVLKVEASKWKLIKKRVVFEIQQPYANHNGGQITFGSDGYLYIGLGDGGWRDDPHNHGQNKQSLLGTILRIDIEPKGKEAYAIPVDNPFKDSPVYLYGIRNPWKFSILPDGRIIVADVGQNKFEEIHLASSGDNLGWNIQEGFHCFVEENCNKTNLNQPIWEYDHSIGQSITGGGIHIQSQRKLVSRRRLYFW